MAKEHHCPNDGAQPCNAAGSIIHICPLCFTRWEEDIADDKPAPAAPAAKASTSAPSAPASSA